MLTRDEQEAVLRKARAMRSNDARLRHKLAHHEISPRRYRELADKAERELADLLKEIG